MGVTVLLVLAAASVRSDDLHLDVMQDELLGGEYYPNKSNSSWYIKFSAKGKICNAVVPPAKKTTLFQIISCAHGMPL